MNKNSYAYVKSKKNVLGIIKSFTENRMSFQYIADELIEDDSFLVDIKIPAYNYSIEDIPVEVVSDEWVINQPSFSCMPIRRVEVKFRNQDLSEQNGLKPSQLFQTLKCL